MTSWGLTCHRLGGRDAAALRLKAHLQELQQPEGTGVTGDTGDKLELSAFLFSLWLLQLRCETTSKLDIWHDIDFLFLDNDTSLTSSKEV